MHMSVGQHKASEQDASSALPTRSASSKEKPGYRNGATASSSSSKTAPKPTRTASTRIQEPKHKSAQATAANSAITTDTGRNSSATPLRPGLQRRRTTARTRYIDMLLNLDAVPPLHNILASLFVWILLAGYIVFPATFNKLKSDKLEEQATSRLSKEALKTVRNVPLLYVAAFACGIGIVGCFWLWIKHRKNYVWVINRIFLPGLLNSVAGLLSTIVNVYSAQDGQYSVTAKVTTIVTAACSVVTAALFLVYNMIMLKRVKKRHDREIAEAERSDANGGEGEKASRTV